jgi:hypothetical protein
MDGILLAAATATFAVGQVLMLETQPDVAECAIIAWGHSVPPRPGCRAVFVQDEQMVKESAALTRRRVVEISSGCIVVQFDRRKAAANTLASGRLRESATESLSALNHKLDELYARRTAELDTDLNAEIDGLEAKAAAIIAARSESRLQPMRAEFAEALRTARELLQNG